MIKRSLIILMLCVYSQSFSQENYAISFGYNDPVIADTAEFFEHLSVECFVVNVGTDTIFSQIRAMISTNPGLGEESVRELLSISFESGSGLNPGDSVHFPAPSIDSPSNGSFDPVLPSNNYIDGDNIIVVWPVIDGPSSFTTEQYSKEIFVKDPNSVEEKSISDIKFLVSNSLIEVSSANIVNQLQLINLEGKLIAESQTNKLSTTSLKPGVYIINVAQKDQLISRTVFIN